MFDLQWLAFQADITRVITFMLGRELNFRTLSRRSASREGHHTMSHHQERPGERSSSYAKLNTYQTELFA